MMGFGSIFGRSNSPQTNQQTTNTQTIVDTTTDSRQYITSGLGGEDLVALALGLVQSLNKSEIKRSEIDLEASGLLLGARELQQKDDILDSNISEKNQLLIFAGLTVGVGLIIYFTK